MKEKDNYRCAECDDDVEDCSSWWRENENEAVCESCYIEWLSKQKQKHMRFYQIRGDEIQGFNVWYRDSDAKYPFITTLYGTSYRGAGVKSWKTFKGASNHITKKFQGWIFETDSQYIQKKNNIK